MKTSRFVAPVTVVIEVITSIVPLTRNTCCMLARRISRNLKLMVQKCSAVRLRVDYKQHPKAAFTALRNWSIGKRNCTVSVHRNSPRTQSRTKHENYMFYTRLYYQIRTSGHPPLCLYDQQIHLASNHKSQTGRYYQKNALYLTTNSWPGSNWTATGS